MIYTCKIDDVAIPSKHILDVKSSEVSFDFAGDKLISSKSEITLSNEDYIYDDRQGTNGFFLDKSWYNNIVQIYDADGNTLWEGRLKKITIDDKKHTCKLDVSDYIQDIINTVCVISESAITPAEAIYNILTDEDYLNIPDDRLVVSSFELSIARQQNSLIDITYEVKDNVKCISVIEELCRISNSHVYMIENKIAMWAWQQFTGVLGTSIKASDIIPGSYQHYVDDDNILNEYSIAYNNSGNVAFATGEDVDSKINYGSGKVFSVPDDKVDSTTSTDFKILYNNSTGAGLIGTSILQRYSDLKKICKFQVGEHLSYLRLGDVVDLRFPPYTREPARLVKYKRDFKKHLIDFEVELVNYPEVVSIDITPPDPVELVSVVPYKNSFVIQWSKSNDDDLISYKLYFSTSQGYWGNEFSGGKFSPINLPEGNVNTLDGNCYYIFDCDTYNLPHYFCITAVDNSFNESEKSNVLSASTYEMLHENMYCTTGNPFISITLDASNSENGSVISDTEWNRYDELNYDAGYYSPTALYRSWIIKSDTGVSSISLLGKGDTGDLKCRWRKIDNGSFGSWSTLQNLQSLTTIDTQNEKDLQFEVIFYSPEWEDTDSFYILNIEEI